MQANFVIACFLSKNLKKVKNHISLETATSVADNVYNSKTCKKWAEIWNIDEQGLVIKDNPCR